jgi:hypothetical protein
MGFPPEPEPQVMEGPDQVRFFFRLGGLDSDPFRG